MIRLKKSDVLLKWKIHKWPGGESFYIGPVHGRLAVASYDTKAEAKAALEMQVWLPKFLGIKP